MQGKKVYFMKYVNYYQSPLGNILLAADETGLTGLWFEGQKYYAKGLNTDFMTKKIPVFEETKHWLDIYFSGNEPDFTPPLHLVGNDFQEDVWKILLKIPYGCTTTYSGIAEKVAGRRGMKNMSAQAVGGAVGRNPISINVPCHRVIASNGSLTGYAGGIDKKIYLLEIEKTGEK